MKKILIFVFLASFLTSCGSNNTVYKNEITVRLKNGMQNDYRLLSLRENSLVLFDAKDESKPEDAFTHAEVLPFDSIRGIYQNIDKGTGLYLEGATIGFLFGFTAGAILSPPADQCRPGEVEGITIVCDRLSKLLLFSGAGAVIGSLLGILVVNLLASPQNEIHIAIPKEREQLRLLSLYPNGEPEKLRHVQ